MPAPLRLEVFEQPDESDAPSLLMPEDLEDLRLNAYERGYLAGWEDAMREAETADRARQAALAQCIEGLNFTYHEARGHVLRALEPLLLAVMRQLLPTLAKATLMPRLVEELMPLADRAGAAPVVLQVPPGMAAAFEAGFEGHPLPPLQIVESADLPPGRAEFTADTRHVAVDLAAIAARCAAAVEEFYRFNLPAEEPRDAANR